MTEATLGVGKDRQAVIDPRGPRNTVQHLARLKHAMREFDNAWHDANQNVLVSFFPALELLFIPNYFSAQKLSHILLVPEFRVKHAVLSAKLSRRNRHS